MAVTRINNNQISDASAGNAYVGINASTKLQPYSITATKLANNLTYGSDFTVTGNLTVQGNTTAIDTTYTTVEDPILLLASNQTGAPSVDIGFVGQRGTSDNIAFVWDESADEFVTAYTTTGESNTIISIASYADLHTGNANIGSNLTVNGTTTLIGNVTGNLSVTGNTASANFLTDGVVSAGGNVLGAGATFTGNVTAQHFIGNIIGNIDAGGANTQVQFNDNDLLNGTAGFTFDKTSNAVVITGNVTGGNLLTAGLVTATSNVTGGNLITAGNVYAPAIINNGAYNTQIELGSASGIIAVTTDGNSTQFLPGGQIRLAGAKTIYGGTLDGSQLVLGTTQTDLVQNRAGNVTVQVGAGGTTTSTWTFTNSGNLIAPGDIDATGNVTGGNLTTAGLVSATGNITSSANVDGANVNATSGITAGTTVIATGNITGGNLATAGKVTATGNITSSANIAGANVIATANLVSVGAEVSGNITGGNLLTPGLVSATGTITSSANISGANVIASANLVSVGAEVSGNITGGNLLTGGRVVATGNITSSANIAGGNLNITSDIRSATIETTGNVLVGGNLTVQGNIQYINVDDLRVEDPIIIMGTGPNGAPLTTDDGMDRGIYMEWYKTGLGNSWIGWENSSGNLIAAADVNFSANNVVNVNDYGTFQAGNIYAQSSLIDGNITGGNLSTGGLISATGNITGGNLSAGSGIISTTGNINGGNINATGNVNSNQGYFTGNVTVVGTFTSTSNIVANTSGIFYGNAITGLGALYAGLPTFTPLGSPVVAQFSGNANSYVQVNFQNINNGTEASTDYIATADDGDDDNYYVDVGINSSTFNDPINYPGFYPHDAYVHNHGGNLIINPETSGTVIKLMVGGTDTTDIIAIVSPTGIDVTGVISANGNISGGNLTTAGQVSATGTITSSANISGANLIASANLVSVGAVVSGNITGGNLLTPGLVSATGTITSSANISGSNVVASANVVSVGAEVSGNITGGNLLTGGLISATGTITSSANISGANLIASANLVSVGAEVSGNITGGNLLTGGLISATGNITGGNLVTPNLVSATTVIATGNVTGANVTTSSLTLNESTINSNAARITVNSNSSDVDFAVNGDTVANVLYVDAGTGTVSIGSSTQTTNVILAMNATNSFLMPVGNTAQRPGVGVTGMLRFNSTLDAVEVYDNDSWNTVGTPNFTVITDQQFNGDGSTVSFTLNEESTTNSTIVSINGIVQIPTIAYSVGGAGNDILTFTEAPQTGDIIDVRKLTTTTQVTSISNSPGNAIVQVNPTSAVVEVTGDLNPSANVTFDLGSPTSRWNELYLAGNTITLGDIVIKDVGSNQIGFFQADGTTPATIDSDNVDTTQIASGTSNVVVASSNGNVRVNIGGTSNIAVFGPLGLDIGGSLELSGNINTTGGNGVANIGGLGAYFNTVHAKATSAQYADLAEVYAADAKYEPGTVLSFGGEAEVTISTTSSDARIAGVVSTNPSYVMNATLNSKHTAVVALTGRVPTLVSGPVSKGDMMVSGGNGRAVACATPSMGTVIGKALENHASGDGVIEVVVGRL